MVVVEEIITRDEDAKDGNCNFHFEESVLLYLLNIDPLDVKRITDEQRKHLHDMFTSNLSTIGISYCDEFLIFTNKNTYNNWQYYAGYEYIKDAHIVNILDVNGCFIAVISGEHDRVEKVLSMLTEETVEE